MEAPLELLKFLFFPLHLLHQYLRKKDVRSKFVASL